MKPSLRAPAVPLITVDPYFSFWSLADRLTDRHVAHWTGRITPMFGLLEIDGAPFRWLGMTNPDFLHLHTEYPAMDQLSCEIRPLTTVCVFEKNGVRIEVSFMTPLVPDDLSLASRPVSYISYSLRSVDGAAHKVRLAFGVNAFCAVNDLSRAVTLGKTDFSVCLGRGDKDVLSSSGDDCLIDWGTLHLVNTNHDACLVPAKELCSSLGRPRRAFPREDRLLEPGTQVPASESPYLFLSKNFDVSSASADGFFALAYDDVHSIEYFGEKIDAWYKSDGTGFEDAVRKAVSEYPSVCEKAKAFEEDLLMRARALGEKYADVVSLAYRQTFAAHKLCRHEGKTLFFSKECFSNGCIATVDVTYPSIPLFLIYNPELVKGMLEPVFRFADSPSWNFDYAPHDVGTYPLANLQVYGLDRKLGRFKEEMQMPVEECGNMILCAAAVCRAEKSPDYALLHRALLEKWVGYLMDKGLDPANQLCTDDFAGRLAHNVNLSAKAIAAIGAWGMILDMAGEDGKKYSDLAKELAKKWKAMAFDGDHYRLAFDAEGTWSIKYNLAWDVLFGLELFDKDVYETEIAYYKTKINACGLPLDNRSDYTKSDWQMWSTVLTGDPAYRDMIIGAMWNMLNTTIYRVPFTDWYYTRTGDQAGFQGRSVQGGLFIPLLKF